MGAKVRVGDLSGMSVEELAATFGDVDAIVFGAGSDGGGKKVTKAIDGNGAAKALEAARLAGVERRALASVHLEESWRERDLGEEIEYYFAVKKDADSALGRSDLNWLILRPSLLLDGPEVGTVSLGPAELGGTHDLRQPVEKPPERRLLPTIRPRKPRFGRFGTDFETAGRSGTEFFDRLEEGCTVRIEPRVHAPGSVDA